MGEPERQIIVKTTPVGFEPTRGDPIGLAGRRLNRSAKMSLMQEVGEKAETEKRFVNVF